MTEPLKDSVLAAMRRISRPLARLMIEAGVGAGEFQAIMKLGFVRAAQEVGNGKPPTASRISALTGLTRRDVSDLLDVPDDAAPDADRGGARIQRVLTGWWTDADFHDELGQPAVLPLRAKGKTPSFASLVKRYSGEPRVLTIRDELVRVKAVREHPGKGKNKKLEALSRSFAPARWDPEGVAALGEQLRDHLETLIHNLKHESRPRFHRVIENTQVDPNHVGLLTRDIGSQADTLMDSLDDALNNPAATVKPGNEVKDATRLGVALYVFEAPVKVRPGSRSKARAKRPRRPAP